MELVSFIANISDTGSDMAIIVLAVYTHFVRKDVHAMAMRFNDYRESNNREHKIIHDRINSIKGDEK